MKSRTNRLIWKSKLLLWKGELKGRSDLFTLFLLGDIMIALIAVLFAGLAAAYLQGDIFLEGLWRPYRVCC